MVCRQATLQATLARHRPGNHLPFERAHGAAGINPSSRCDRHQIVVWCSAPDQLQLPPHLAGFKRDTCAFHHAFSQVVGFLRARFAAQIFQGVDIHRPDGQRIRRPAPVPRFCTDVLRHVQPRLRRARIAALPTCRFKCRQQAFISY